MLSTDPATVSALFSLPPSEPMLVGRLSSQRPSPILFLFLFLFCFSSPFPNFREAAAW
jgi:hypothetical protein